jgi:3-hydroxymyristoyl/3-hydroxydecanoyl-(acyl carrier protein) dehydratase
MKFPAAARPGERIILTAKKTGEIGGLSMFDVHADMDGKIVAAGQIVLNEMKSAS